MTRYYVQFATDALKQIGALRAASDAETFTISDAETAALRDILERYEHRGGDGLAHDQLLNLMGAVEAIIVARRDGGNVAAAIREYEEQRTLVAGEIFRRAEMDAAWVRSIEGTRAFRARLAAQRLSAELAVVQRRVLGLLDDKIAALEKLRENGDFEAAKRKTDAIEAQLAADLPRLPEV